MNKGIDVSAYQDNLRQYRTELVRKIRSQIAQKSCRYTDVCHEILYSEWQKICRLISYKSVMRTLCGVACNLFI